MTATPGRRPRRVLPAVLIALCAVVPFVGALDAGFVWTDHHFVEGNDTLQTWASIPDMFTSDAWRIRGDLRSIGYYRPVRNLTFLADTQLFGNTPAGYHLTNLLIHALCSLLVFGVVRRVFGDANDRSVATRLAFWSAVFFAVHPVHIEAVAWITGRTDSCAALGYLTALYAWLRASEGRPRWGWWLVGCLGAAWGLLSKESAATLPAALALCLWVRNRAGDRRILNLVVRCAPAAVLTVVYLGVRAAVLTSVTNHSLWGGTRWTNTLTAIGLVGPYARLLVFGRPLIAIYEEHTRTTLADPAVLLGLGLIVATLAVATQYRRFPRIAFGAAWTALTILPVLHILPFKVLMAERFLYLPSIGWCVALAAALRGVARKREAVATIVALGIVAGYVTATVRHVPAWDNDFALFEDSLRKAPNSTEAVMALARAHRDAEQYTEARDLYRRATELSPNYYLAWYNRGIAHLDLDEPYHAYYAFQQATRAEPTNPGAWWPLGRTAYELDDLEMAVKAFAAAARLQPTEGHYHWWGRALARSGRWDEAAAVFQRGIAGGASSASILAEAGNALLETGAGAEGGALLADARRTDPDVAARFLADAANAMVTDEPGHGRYLARVAIRLAPDDPAVIGRYVALVEATAPDAAVAALRAYMERHPDDVAAAAGLVALLVRLERAGAAAEAARALVDAHPDASAAHGAYAQERRLAGDMSAARAAAERATELAPETGAWWLLLGDIALRMNDAPAAVPALERADALAPNRLPTLRLLARAYAAAGRSADAARIAERGLRAFPQDATLLAVADDARARGSGL